MTTPCEACEVPIDLDGFGCGRDEICDECGTVQWGCGADACALHHGHCVTAEPEVPEICALCFDDTEGNERR